MIHEIGHSLGLYHVFRGISEILSCSDPCMETEPSFETGDLCSDTNPAPKHKLCGDPGPGNDTCGFHSFLNTPFSNFMSYAGTGLCSGVLWLGRNKELQYYPWLLSPFLGGFYADKGLEPSLMRDQTWQPLESLLVLLFLYPSFPQITVSCEDQAEGLGDGRNEISIKKTASKDSTANLTPYFSEIWMPDLWGLWKTQIQILFLLSQGDIECQVNIDTIKAVG